MLLLAAAAVVSAFGQAKPSVSILGDSYSTFEGWLTPDTNAVWYTVPPDTRHTDVKGVDQTWWHQVLKRKGWKLEVNNSYSGSTVCNTGYRDEDYTHESFVTRMTALGTPDIILIFGGTNDSWAGSPIGEFKYDGIRRADLFSCRHIFHIQRRAQGKHNAVCRHHLLALRCATHTAQGHRQEERPPQRGGHEADCRPGVRGHTVTPMRPWPAPKGAAAWGCSRGPWGRLGG